MSGSRRIWVYEWEEPFAGPLPEPQNGIQQLRIDQYGQTQWRVKGEGQRWVDLGPMENTEGREIARLALAGRIKKDGET